MVDLQSDILENPRKILSDLVLIVSQKSRIPDEVMNALVERASEVVSEVKPGSREWDRIARFMQREEKLGLERKRLQTEVYRVLLSILAPQVATAVQVNIDTQRASEQDEVLNDLIARTTAETRAILDAHGPANAGDDRGQQPHPDRPGGNGDGRPVEPA